MNLLGVKGKHMSWKGVVTGCDFSTESSDEGSASETQMRLIALQKQLADQIRLHQTLVAQRKAVSNLFTPAQLSSAISDALGCAASTVTHHKKKSHKKR